jgi:hypothetical protein
MTANNVSDMAKSDSVTLDELREMCGAKPDAFRIALKKKTGRGYAKNETATPSEIATMTEYYATLKSGEAKRAEKPKQAAAIPVRQAPEKQDLAPAKRQAPIIAPAKSEDSKAPVVFLSPLAVSVVSVALTIGGLNRFAGVYGVGLGLMFAMYLLSAVWVARDRMKGDTSTDALKTVLYAELGACILHFFTFASILPDFGQAWSVPFKYGAALLCAGSVAFLSYKSVILVRNYNSEV